MIKLQGVSVEWKITLKHRSNLWKIEIVGIGEDPHMPADVVVTMDPATLDKFVKEIKARKHSVAAFLPSELQQSEDDMYLWKAAAGSFIAANPDWDMEDNLPEPRIEDDEEVKELRGRGINPIF